MYIIQDLPYKGAGPFDFSAYAGIIKKDKISCNEIGFRAS